MKVKQKLLIIPGIIGIVVVANDIIIRKVDLLSLTLWIISIVTTYLSGIFYNKTVKHPSPHTSKKTPKRKIYSLLAILIILTSVRLIYMMDFNYFHGDEYQTAYFSLNLKKYSQPLDWFGVYPPKVDWVSQFPILFFYFQSLFFKIFGIGPLVVRLSILPYLIATGVFIILIAKELGNTKTAIFSGIVLAFLAPDIYITVPGLHFISSSAFFSAFLYFFLKSIKVNKKNYLGLTGIFMGLSFHTYYSSYLALPIFITTLVFCLIFKKINLEKLKNYLFSLLIFFLIVAPLLTYALKIENFLTQRTGQISLFKGEWSPYAEEISIASDYFDTLQKNFSTSLKSLYQKDIGGQGGYNFGHLALFNKPTFILLILGLILLLFQLVKKRNAVTIAIILVSTTPFLGGIILTMPPPAFHRSALAFPFIAIIIGNLLDKFYSLIKKFKFRQILISAILGIIIVSNISHLEQMLTIEKTKNSWLKEHFQIERVIKKYDGDTVFISAFDSYALGRILLFRLKGEKRFITGNLERYSELIIEQKPLLILHYPDEEKKQFIDDNFTKTKTILTTEAHQIIELF